MKTRIVETADAVRSPSSVVKSLSRWYLRRQAVLQHERRLFREEISARNSRGESAADIEQALRENADEQRTLDVGWAHSSLRHHVEHRDDRPTENSIEQRVALLDVARMSPPPRAEVREAGTSPVTTCKRLEGYGAVFDSWSVNLGGFREKIQAGAFAEALTISDIRVLFNHNADHVFGRSTSKTLEVKEDGKGLFFRCYLLPFDGPSYSLARRIDRMDLSGCSFSFAIAPDGDRWKLAQRRGELDERTIVKFDQIFDVGPVTYPAYPSTTVAAIFENVQRSCEPGMDISRRMTGEERAAFYDELDAIDEQISRERDRAAGVAYRTAGRVLNRCRAAMDTNSG